MDEHYNFQQETFTESTVVNEPNYGTPQNSQKPPKKKKKGDFLKLTIYATMFGLLGGVSFYGVSKMVSSNNNSSNTPTNQTVVSSDSNSIVSTSVISGSAVEGDGVSAVASAVLPSIVQINVKATTSQSDMFGQTQQYESSGSGSGIIVAQNSSDILIATNNHVVEGASSVDIVFCDGETVSATVKGTDSTADLAVVSVKESALKDTTKKQIKVAALGDSDSLKVGEQAIAIGNAMGYGTSVTVGYISAKDREISMEDANMKLLQTDAAINPGNSGGALVNIKGEVVGINSAKFASEEVEGMGFAIPISTAIPIINELMNQEPIPESEQAYLGIKGTDVTSEYATYYNMPEGIYVSDVTSGSPADKAGIEKGYVITGVNDKSVKTLSALASVLENIKSGDKGTITVEVSNNGTYEEKEISVTFGAKSSTATN